MGKPQERIAKISPPHLHAVYKRIRLFDFLDGHGKSTAVWISGVPGSGKTTLAASYIETKQIPCLWYHFDEGDSDVATFFHYFFLAAGRWLVQNNQHGLPEFRPENLSSISVFVRSFFRTFFSRCSRPIALVFDDFHVISHEDIFHEIIRAAIEEAPLGVRLFIASRFDPPDVLQRLVLNKRMVPIESDDLRLDEKEIRIIATRNYGLERNSREINEIRRTTDGWAAGTMLMLENPGRKLNPDQCNEINRDACFGYFAGEIFRSLSPRVREFLLRTAYFPTITGATADLVTGWSGSERILEDLCRKNYFTEKFNGSTSAYRYHPLFRSFLVWQAGEYFGDKGAKRNALHAAGHLVADGEYEAAISLYSTLGEWKKVLSLIQEQAQSMLEMGRFKELKSWLKRVPEDLLERSPWGLFYLGLCYLHYSPLKARASFEKGYELFPRSNFIGRFAAWSGVVDSILYTWDDFSALDPWIEKMEKMQRGYLFLPLAVLKNRVAASMFGALIYRKPFHRDIKKWTRRAASAIEASMPLSQRMLLSYMLVTSYVWNGEFAKAKLVIDRVKSESNKTSVPLLKITGCVIASTYHWLADADYQGCLSEANLGLEIADESGVHLFDGQLLGNLVAGAMASGNHGDAAGYLDRMNQCVGQGRRLERSFYHHMAGWLAMMENKESLALEHAETALCLAEKAGVVMPQALNLQSKALLSVGRGNYKEARELVIRAKSFGRGMYAGIMRFFRHLLLADIYLKQGLRKKGLEELRAGLKQGRAKNFMTTPWWNPDFMADLCCEAVRAGIETEYVEKLIRRHHLFPARSPVEVLNWPWRIKIYTLGRFSVVIDGKPLRFSGKSQQKPLELLKTLIALGGRDISREKLEGILWPDSDGDKARQAMVTTVHRLRRLLGFEQCIELSDKKFTLDNRFCWVDIWALERLFGQVAALPGQGVVKEEDLVRMTDGVMVLYLGEFYASESEEQWVWQARARLKSRYLASIACLARAWEELGKCEKAATLYLRGIEVDRLTEEFYQGLMECYIRQGRLADALSIYDACRRALEQGLGVSPSPRTMELHRMIG